MFNYCKAPDYRTENIWKLKGCVQVQWLVMETETELDVGFVFLYLQSPDGQPPI